MDLNTGTQTLDDAADAERAALEFARRTAPGQTTPEETPAGPTALVLIVDDAVVHGEAPSPVGALVTELLVEDDFVVDALVAVESEELEIRTALNTAVAGGVDLVVTVGGVGVAGRDVTPEVTAELVERRIIGIEQALRGSALAAGAVDAAVSRGVAGMSGSTLIVNLASSRSAVRDGMATLTPLAKYVIAHVEF